MKLRTNKGLSIIELVIGISILVVLVALIVPGLSKFRNEQALKNTTEDIISLLKQAKSDTQSSLNSTNYSVRFESTRAVYFVGSVFTDGLSTNKVITFNTAVAIPASGGINLYGAGNNVTFTRLTGDTAMYGNIVVRLASDVTRQKTITITKTGSVSSN